MQEYAAAVRLDGNNVEGLTAAGQLAFQTGNYAQAEAYLRAALDANPDSQDTRHLLTLTKLVLSADPLSPHLTAREKQNRLQAGLERSGKRLDECLSQTHDEKAIAELQSLKTEAIAAETKLRGESPSETDNVRAGVDLIFRMQQTASGACGNPSDADQALLLIGRQHNGERP